MANREFNINQRLAAFEKGEYDNADVTVQINAGWYDWFCKDESLANKTKALYTKLKQIAGSKKIDKEKNYVFFKNNCPMDGSLYDDFRICDIATGNVIYTITPRSGHRSLKGIGEVYGAENGFKGPLFSGSWKQIKQWFLA